MTTSVQLAYINWHVNWWVSMSPRVSKTPSWVHVEGTPQYGEHTDPDVGPTWLKNDDGVAVHLLTPYWNMTSPPSISMNTLAVIYGIDNWTRSRSLLSEVWMARSKLVLRLPSVKTIICDCSVELSIGDHPYLIPRKLYKRFKWVSPKSIPNIPMV